MERRVAILPGPISSPQMGFRAPIHVLSLSLLADSSIWILAKANYWVGKFFAPCGMVVTHPAPIRLQGFLVILNIFKYVSFLVPLWHIIKALTHWSGIQPCNCVGSALSFLAPIHHVIILQRPSCGMDCAAKSFSARWVPAKRCQDATFIPTCDINHIAFWVTACKNYARSVEKMEPNSQITQIQTNR